MILTRYWGLLTPEDNGKPEMFFATEPWARSALEMLQADLPPERAEMIRLVRVEVAIIAVETPEAAGGLLGLLPDDRS